MKLKRIASAVLAAVMAVTSTVVCEVTAGAAEVTSLPYKTESSDTLWYDSYYKVSKDDLSVVAAKASDAYFYFNYTSTDTTAWGSQYEIKQQDDSYTTITGCVNISISSNGSYVLVPYTSAYANGIYFSGWNVTVPEMGLTYKLGNKSVSFTDTSSSGWEETGIVPAITIPSGTKYIGVKYTSPDTDAWGSQIKICDKDWTEVIPATNLSNAGTSGGEAYFSATGFPTEIKMQGYNISVSEIVFYGDYVPVSSVTITNKPANTTVKVNDTITLEAKVNDDATVSDKTVAWRSLDSSVADYADNSGAGKLSGEFKFLKAGTVTIEAVYGPDNSIKDTVTFTVLEADVKVNKVTITKPTTTEYTVGSDVTLEAKVNDDANVADKTIKWSSSDANIASVDETTGKVTFKKAGEVTITAFYGSDSTIKDTITLVVSEPVNDDYVESPIHYDETTADAAKPINITLNGSSTNSVLYVMSVSEQDAKTFSGVKVKVLNDDGTVIKEITLNTVYQAFKFVGADNVKYIESGVAGRYFAIVRIDNVNAVGSFTVSMELVK